MKKFILFFAMILGASVIFAQTATLRLHMPTTPLPGEDFFVEFWLDELTYSPATMKSAQIFLEFDEAVLLPVSTGPPFFRYWYDLNQMFVDYSAQPANSYPNPGDLRYVFFTTVAPGIDPQWYGGVPIKLWDIKFHYNGGDLNIQFGTTPKLEPVSPFVAGGTMTKGETIVTAWDNSYYALTLIGIGGVANVWTGAINDEWNNPGNWSDMVVPGPTTNVEIPDVTKAPFPIISGVVATGALTIFPLAQLTIAPMAGLTTNGLFTNDGLFLIQSDGLSGYAGTYIDMAGIAGVGVFEFDRDVLCSGTVGGSANPLGWHYLAAPFDGFTTDNMPDYFVNAWDQPTGMWIQYSMDPYLFPCTPWPTTPLNTMDAWSINFDLNYPDPLCPGLPPGTGNIVEFIGGAVDVHTGAYNAPLGYGAGAYQEWNLVSNPYPSGLDVDLIAWGPNTVQAAAYYDGCAGNYVYWATGMGSYVMAPTLGFFVETVAADVFPVTNAERAHGADWFWKSEVTDLLTLEATGNDKSDVLHVRFADNVTAGFDLNGDAHKLFAENEGLAQIYTLAGEEMLAINAQPAAEMVPMGFTSVGSGTFTIEAIETSDFADVVLEDLFEETQTDLLAGSYTFNYTAGDDPNRFIIHFTPVGTPELEANSINIWSSEHNIYVNVPETANGDIIVFNMMGQEMLRTDINPGCVNVIPMEKVNTYYVVKVLTSKNAVTGKVYIK